MKFFTEIERKNVILSENNKTKKMKKDKGSIRFLIILLIGLAVFVFMLCLGFAVIDDWGINTNDTIVIIIMSIIMIFICTVGIFNILIEGTKYDALYIVEKEKEKISETISEKNNQITTNNSPPSANL